jgi:hypothetical protein
VTVTAAAPPRAVSRYFVNAPVDFAFVGGLSILVFAAMALFAPRERTPEVVQLALLLMWVVNWPHFSMSTYRLYQSRAHVQQYPFTAYVIPFVVVGATVLAYLQPATFAPYFVKLFVIWSPYHFSGQTIGVTLLYARRSGVGIGKWERRALDTFVYGTFLLSSIRAEVSREGFQYYGIPYPSFGVPAWAVTATEIGFWAAAIAFAGLVVAWCVRHKRWIPAIVLVAPVAQYVWFVQAIYLPSFQEFVPLFHSLQYMLIAWSIQLAEKLQLGRLAATRARVATETAKWGVANFAGGVLLFYLLPEVGVLAGHDRLFSTGVIFAAVQIHHFFVDGVIWKLRDARVANPLMASVPDLVRGGAVSPAPVRASG